MSYTVERSGLNRYTVQPVIWNGSKYVLLFNMDNDCIVHVYQYKEQKRLFRGHKGNFICSHKIKEIKTRDGKIIEDVSLLTDYGFRKYLFEIIDVVLLKHNNSHQVV